MPTEVHQPVAWSASAAGVTAALRTDPVAGLTDAEAATRLASFGPNELPPEPPRSLVRSILGQLRETIIVVLLVAAVLTAVTGDVADCAVILLVVTINTVTGVLQERRAIGAVTALRGLTTPHCVVVRDGRPATIQSPELVPGDLILFKEGDVVGADARLISAHELQVDEALLTGESLPAARDEAASVAVGAAVGDRTTMMHAGTMVVHGSGSAVVVSTGIDTQLGHIAHLLHEHTAPETPLQRRLAVLGRRLSAVAVVGCAIVVVIGLLRDQPWELMVVAGISLAVAAIPESLPAVVTLALAGGTRRMARQGAIVRSLPAVEALGSVTVLATDKTGTLTTGHPECIALWTPDTGEITPGSTTFAEDDAGVVDGGRGSLALLQAVALCSDATSGSGGTEGALLSAAEAAGISSSQLRESLPRTRMLPFDSNRRFMRTWHTMPGGTLQVIKGAPEVVLGMSPKPTAAAMLETWARQAYRVLAVAADFGTGFVLLGLLAMADPVRNDARDAVAAARAAGIRVVMITGDHPATAAAVARAVGIDTSPSALDPDRGDLRPVYARTDPGGKLDIVTAWQRAGDVVAMTGDGVNDAPALRAADVGVAMGRRGTDVAREAADLVITDDSLGTIIKAVAEGRRVYDNVQRFLRFGLSGGLAEILIMLLGPFIGLPLPLLPGQILWVNLITHGLPGVAMGAESAEPDVLRRPPRPPVEGILTHRAAWEVLTLGTLLTMCCLGLATFAVLAGMPWQTMIFVTLTMGQLGIALSTRSSLRPVWRMSASGNPFLYWAVAASAAMLAAAIYAPVLRDLLGTVPLTTTELAIAMAAGAIPAALVELVKLRRRHQSATDHW